METCTDDVIFAIASFLKPNDLVNLALVCKRFGSKNATSKTELSMMEESSRHRITIATKDAWKNNHWRDSDLLWIRRDERESWMAVHHRLHLIQTELVFSHVIGDAITYVDGDIKHIQGRRSIGGTDGLSVAMCQKVMESGRHYAEFIVTKLGGSNGIIAGIIRHEDAKDLSNRKRLGDIIHRQSFYLESYLLKRGDVIGLVLDFDDGGELTVYINGFFPGVEPRRGLSGQYCWVVTMDHGITSPDTENRGFSSSIRILSSSPI
ncbi:hypothetical protein ACHAXA_004722 [Cyclostephanos tholiformis]|uniref:F-box domain-containing protein n=1 Tax=Cyclostephanos tholiformis TaxID=382380 RepID=A0ABD3SRR3_9STRA